MAASGDRRSAMVRLVEQLAGCWQLTKKAVSRSSQPGAYAE